MNWRLLRCERSGDTPSDVPLNEDGLLRWRSFMQRRAPWGSSGKQSSHVESRTHAPGGSAVVVLGTRQKPFAAAIEALEGDPGRHACRGRP